MTMTAEKLATLTKEDVLTAYRGAARGCACGCKGTHRSPAVNAVAADKHRGYADPKAVNDAFVKTVLRALQEAVAAGTTEPDYYTDQVAAVVDGKLLMVVIKEAA